MGLGPGYIRRLNSLPEPEAVSTLQAKKGRWLSFSCLPIYDLRVPETLSLVVMDMNGLLCFFVLNDEMRID